MCDGNVLRKNRRFLKELSPSACKKIEFRGNNVDPTYVLHPPMKTGIMKAL